MPGFEFFGGNFSGLVKRDSRRHSRLAKTRLEARQIASPRNGRRSPRSDDNMNDSCVKILCISVYMRETAIMFHQRPRKFRNVRCFEFK